jgi:hypothetical protein
MKLTSINGEYMLLARKNVDEGNIFIQYGQGEDRTVGIVGGPGKQQAEFVDGLRFTVESDVDLKMTVELKSDLPQSAMPEGMMSLSTFTTPPLCRDYPIF